MHRAIFACGVLIFVLTCVSFIALLGSEQDRAYTDPSGTWYVLVARPEGGATPEIITFHQDGRYNFTVPGGSSGHGEWVKTGSHDVRSVALRFIVDQSTSKLTSVEEGRAVLHFSDDFSLFTGKWFAVEFKCDGPYNCPYPLIDKTYRLLTPKEGLAIRGRRLGATLSEEESERF